MRSSWGLNFQPTEGQFYVDYESEYSRMLIYQGLDRECDIYGDSSYIRKVTNTTGVIYVDKIIMNRLLSLCQDVHLQLISSYFDEEDVADDGWDRKSSSSNNPLSSIWSMNILNSILIFPGTKWWRSRGHR